MFRIRFFPLTVFLILLAADQLTRIPAIAEAGMPEPTPMQNMTESMKTVFSEYKSENRKNVIFFLGSSRSEIFSYLKKPVIEKSLQISSDAKKNLLELQLEPRFITRAADMLTIHVYIHTLIRSGYKPDYVILEISPEIFNRNRPVNIPSQINANILDKDLLYELLPLLEGNERMEIFARLLFHSYAARIKPENIIRHLTGEKDEATSEFVHALLAKGDNLKNLPADYKYFHENNIPEPYYQERFINYTEYLKKDIGLADFHTDPAAVRLFLKSAEKLKKNGYKLILFTPAVHELIRKEWDRSGFSEVREHLLEKVKGENVHYSDLNQDNACPYYIDSSHMAYICGPYVLHRLLTEAGYFKNE